MLLTHITISGACPVADPASSLNPGIWNSASMLYQWMGGLVSKSVHNHLHQVSFHFNVSSISNSWGHHIHYDLEFRGWTVSESRRYAWQRKSEYANFGAIAVALELIPIFNLLFMWTNAVGAALWVADQYEENERKIASQTPSVEGLTTLDPYGRRAPTAEPSAATLYPDESTYLVHKK